MKELEELNFTKEELINEIYTGIENKLQTEGMEFNSDFYDFVDKSLNLNDGSLEKHYEDYGVVDAVESRTQAFMDYSGYENSEFALEIAENTTNSGVLDKLSNSESEEVLKAVIENENVSSYTLEQLSQHDNENINEIASDALSNKEIESNENNLRDKTYEDIKENYQEDFSNTSDEFKLEYMKTLDDELSMTKAYIENLEDMKDSVVENGLDYYKDELQQNLNDAIDEINEVYKGSSKEVIDNEIQKEEENFKSASDLHSEEVSNKLYEIDNEIISEQNNVSSLENQLEDLKKDYPEIAEAYEKNKENEAKEEISSENVSNNEIQEQKTEDVNSSNEIQENKEENSFSSMFGENDFLADNRESDFAFDRGFAEFADNFDKKLADEIAEKGTLFEEFKERLENENDRISDKLSDYEATSEKVIEPEASVESNEKVADNTETQEIKEPEANVVETVNEVSIETNSSKDDLAEFGNAIQDFKDLTNSEEAQAYKEEALNSESNKASDLFNQRDELLNQLETERENPINGIYDIEQKLESVNEQINQLSNDELKDYNNSISSEITQEQRDEQKISEREGQKDLEQEAKPSSEVFTDEEKRLEMEAINKELDSRSFFDDMKDSISETVNGWVNDIKEFYNDVKEVISESLENNKSSEPEATSEKIVEGNTETNLNKDDLVNQLEKESGFYDKEPTNNTEASTEANIEVSSNQEATKETNIEASSDKEQDLKMELAKEEFSSFAEKNLPENERDEFTSFMLENNAESIKNADSFESFNNQISSSLENSVEDFKEYQEIKQDVMKELESENKQEFNSEKEVSNNLTNSESEKNMDSNVSSNKEQQKQTEIEFGSEVGSSK